MLSFTGATSANKPSTASRLSSPLPHHRLPRLQLAFRLYTDVCTAGLGAILAKIQDGKERIICCASCSLNQAEKAYPTTKLECLAIVWAVAKFRPYLMSMSFEVYGQVDIYRTRTRAVQNL